MTHRKTLADLMMEEDYMNDSPFLPPREKLMRFMVNFKCMKAASVPFYITKQNPVSPLNSDKSSTTTCVKHIVHKYGRLVKHKISSQRFTDAQTGVRQLNMNEGSVSPCIAGESGRQIHVSFRYSGAESCVPSMNSSLSFCSENLESAIAYCKQSNGGIGMKQHLT